jgi:hypothetical protein
MSKNTSSPEQRTRCGFYIYGSKNWPLGYEKAKYGSVGISASRNRSAWVGPIVTSFSFMFAVAGRHGSVQVNQELDAGSKQLIIHSVNTVTQPDFEPGPYGIKPYRPGSTRIGPHRNPCQFLMVFGGIIRRRKIYVYVQNFYTDFNSVLMSVLTQF